MFCPQCGSNQGERRFCTSCGTNLAAVSQALQRPASANQTFAPPQYVAPPLSPYEMERQREYANGMKMLLVGGVFLGYNLLKFILSFGHSSLGFFGFIGLIVFAVGLSKVLSWRQIAGGATPSILNTVPAPSAYAAQPQASPATAQLPRPNAAPVAAPAVPQPVFSALEPGVRTDELEPARRTTHTATPAKLATPAQPIASSVIEEDTRQLSNQQATHGAAPISRSTS